MTSADSTPPSTALIKEVIKRLSFGFFPFEIELKMSHQDYGLLIRIKTRERDSGDPTFVEAYKTIPSWFQRPYQFEAVCIWIADEVMGLVKHELFESVTYDGKRIFDPHKPLKRSVPVNAAEEMVTDMLKNLADLRAGQKSKD